MMENLAPGQEWTPGPRGIVDEFVACDSGDALDTALGLATSHGLLVGPSTGAAVRCALEFGSRPESTGKRIVVVAPSSGVRYLQVSFLLCTVTFVANLAHSLTRSP